MSQSATRLITLILLLQRQPNQKAAELALTNQVFQVPDDFDAHAYLAAEMQDQPKLQVQMCFAPQAADVARGNRSNWEQMQERPDGSVEVLFSCPDSSWTASTALAYGPIVTVLEPAELRHMVREWAEAVISLYQSDNQEMDGE